MKRIILAVAASLLLLSGCACPTLPVGGGSGNLNLYGIDPYTLDPALAGDSASVEYITQIFSGLVRLDERLEPIPDIAESWVVSADGRIYTFYLRKDVFFHNGRQVKAADFKYSWERAAAPETGSQTVPSYLDDIAGIKEVLLGQTKNISGVSAVDEHTLRVELAAPKSCFLAKLSYVTSYVVDQKDVARGRDWWRNPSGTGPFKLGRWERGTKIVLTRFSDYYGEKAKLSSVTYHLWAGFPMSLYEMGTIDIAEIGAAYYDLVTDPAGIFYTELVTTSRLSLEYIIFDVTKAPFDDINVRQAFAMAVDKTRLAALLYRNTVVPVEGVLPPGIPGFNEYLLGIPFDPERARERLGASRYGDDMPAVILTAAGYGGQISSVLEAIIYDWKLYLGVDVVVRQLEPEEYFYNIFTEKDNMVVFGWSADYPHPQNFLEVLFGSGMPYNIGEYASPEYNDLIKRAGTELNEAESLKLYREAEQLLAADAACIPLWSDEGFTLIKPYVRGYAPNPLGIVRLNMVWLEK